MPTKTARRPAKPARPAKPHRAAKPAKLARPQRARKSASTTDLLVAMIIDKSGSMRDKSAQTVSGFNEYLADRKRETPEAKMSVTLFDDKRTMLHVCQDAAQIPELTVEKYQAGGMGMTALYDAIGATVTAIEREAANEKRNILVVIMTDGLENASAEYRHAQIANLIASKEQAGWKFVFFGADPISAGQSRDLNVSPLRSVQYENTAAGVQRSYAALSTATTLFASGAHNWEASLHDAADPNAKPQRRPGSPLR